MPGTDWADDGIGGLRNTVVWPGSYSRLSCSSPFRFFGYGVSRCSLNKMVCMCFSCWPTLLRWRVLPSRSVVDDGRHGHHACAVYRFVFGPRRFHAAATRSSHPHPNMDIADLALERNPNIHVVMFDGLVNSAFSKEFMSERSPRADYLSQLDDSIYAGKLGFADCLSTTSSWDALFGLGHIHRTDEYGRSLHFSGMYSSPLAGLLRNNGYLI